MKILFCIPNMAGGGAERQLVYLSAELVRRGWAVHVALLKEGPNYAELSSAGVTVHKLPSSGNHDIFLLWRLFKLIQTLKPDIVHTWLTQMDVFGGIASRLAGVPFVVSERSSSVGYSLTWKHRLRINVARWAGAVISNSSGGDDYWKSHLPRLARYIVPNGMPLDRISLAVDTSPFCPMPGDPPMVLYVGRLTSDRTGRKNLALLLQALAQVKKTVGITVILCGEGPQLDELKKIASRLGLDGNVHFAGHLPAASVWALMKKAAAFVSLSAYEGLPNAVMEAMACGCPLVLSDIPAHRALLDDEMAIFVDPEKIATVADAILSSIRNLERAAQAAQNAKRKVTRFAIPAIADQYVKIYMQVLSNNKVSTSSIAGDN